MSSDYVDVLPDLRLPRTVALSTRTQIRGGIDVKVEVEYDETQRRYVMTSVEYSRDVQDGGLTAAEIRRVGFAESAFDLLPSRVEIEGRPAILTIPASGAGVRQLHTNESLLMIARKYALARALGTSPLLDVAEWLGVSRATAARDVARAREAGLLDG